MTQNFYHMQIVTQNDDWNHYNYVMSNDYSISYRNFVGQTSQNFDFNSIVKIWLVQNLEKQKRCAILPLE